MILKIDEFGQVINCAENGYRIHDYLKEGKTVAISLSLGNMTRYEISFVPLAECIPIGVLYDDGSNRGVQINIDRKGSYALPWGSNTHWTSLRKWGIDNKSDAECLTTFFNAVLSGGKASKLKPKKTSLSDVLALIDKQKKSIGKLEGALDEGVGPNDDDTEIINNRFVQKLKQETDSYDAFAQHWASNYKKKSEIINKKIKGK